MTQWLGVSAALGLALLAGCGGAGGDLETARTRTVALYAGRAGGSGGPAHKAAVADIERRAQKHLTDRSAFLDRSRPANERGGEYDVARHYGAILVMAQAFAAPDSALRGSANLRRRIEEELTRGLDWTRPGTPRPGNWYPWMISTPQALGPALLLLEGKIDANVFQQSLAALADLAQEPSLNGANAVWEARNHLYMGLLQRNAARVDKAADFLRREATVGGGGSGLLEDYSFQFHGRLLHTSGYGTGYAYSAAEFAYLCDGTRWALSDAKKRLLADHLIEHARWVAVGKYHDLSVKGRGVASPASAAPHMAAMLLLAAAYPAQADALNQAAAGMLTHGLMALSLETASLSDAWDDSHHGTPKPLGGFRHFYASDFAVFRQPDFYTSVRMYSDRLIDYEGNWGANLEGWFLAYGLTYFSRTGDEYWRTGAIRSKDFDWDRLPGTTTRVGVHPAQAYNTGKSPFAGGAGGSTPESGGVCGFILIPAAGDFTARKSYHFFDRGFVALGSGIASTAATPRAEPVVTTVTQWAAPEANLPLVIADETGPRAVPPANGEQTWKNVRWAWHDGVGYYFFEPVTLHGRRRGVLTTLWLDHGNNPQGAKYAYAVLPSATKEETAAFTEKPSVRIACHNETAHACEDAKGAALGILFWQKGEVAGVSVSAPLALYTESRSTGREVSVQNPLHTQVPIVLVRPAEWLPLSTVAPDVRVEVQPLIASGGLRPRPARIVQVWTAAGRIYRLGFGLSDVPQEPHEDFLPYSSFPVEAASEGDLTTLTVHLPPPAIKDGYRLLIRGPQGHLRAELTDKDIVDRPAPGVVRYRWQRTGKALDAATATAILETPLHLAQSAFATPARPASQPASQSASRP